MYMSDNHPALFFEKRKDRKVKCTLCPRYCIIPMDKTGFCGVRKNEEGSLVSLIYGNASSMAIDPIEKKPLYNFFPGTLVFSLGSFGCNMHCGHCQNWQISHAGISDSINELKNNDISTIRPADYVTPEMAIDLALQNDCEGISWTYNEPSIWFEYVLDCAKLAKEKGLYTAFITNGYINQEPLDMIAPYIDAYRVDIKAFNNDIYNDLCKVPDMKTILDGTVRMKQKWGKHVEIVTNIIPKVNDDRSQLESIAEWIVTNLGKDTPWHITRYFPQINYSEKPITPESTLEMAYEIGTDAGLEYVYVGNSTDTELSNTFCPGCGTMVIERKGYDLISYDLDADAKCTFCGKLVNVKWGI